MPASLRTTVWLAVLWCVAAIAYNATYALFVTSSGFIIPGKRAGLTEENVIFFLLYSTPAFGALAIYALLSRGRAWLPGILAGLGGLIFTVQGVANLDAFLPELLSTDPLCLATPCPDRVFVLDSWSSAQIHDINAVRALAVASVTKNALSVVVPLLTLFVLWRNRDRFRRSASSSS